MMHIVVFGAGGVGGYFGARLAQAGERVTFIARGRHLDAMLSNGLTIESTQGEFTVHPVYATDDTTQVADVDAVLMCVKAWQVPECARSVQSMVGPKTLVVPLENGIEAPSQLAEVLGKQHVGGGLCRLSSWIVSPGHIKQAGFEPSIAFGELDNRTSQRCETLLESFLNAGLQAEIPPDINLAMWQKFLFISAVSGLGALTRVPVGIFREQPGTRRILEGELKECYEVAVACGIPFPPGSASATLSFIDTLPPGTTASLQRDIMEGKPSELESQNGVIVRLGRQLGIPTPNHEFIYHSLLPQEALARRLVS